MLDEDTPESFAEFKNSFSYGSRTDLNFKFFKSLSPTDAARFIQELLWKLSDSADDGDLGRLVDHTLAWQQRAYAGAGRWTYESGPFTRLAKPVSTARLALFTSSGHFVAGQDPEPFGIKTMSQEEAVRRIDDFIREEPHLSIIPVETPSSDLRVRHGGYDVRSATADPNVVFPITRLRELAAEGRIGDLAADAYSFVGACAQTLLLKRIGPRWVALLQKQGIEAVLLVPV